MAELKTKPTGASVSAFLNGIGDKQRREDCGAVAAMMSAVTGKKPKMWGSGIVGFGSLHYNYGSGREGDWFQTGFAPRKDSLTVYIWGGFQRFPELMMKLGKHKTGVGCLYIKRLADVDATVLRELVERSVKEWKAGESPD